MFGYVDALKDDYQLILVDMRGHGKSDKPDDPRAYNAEIQVSDIVAVLDALGIDKSQLFWLLLGCETRLGANQVCSRTFSLVHHRRTHAARWDDSDWAAWLLANGSGWEWRVW